LESRPNTTGSPDLRCERQDPIAVQKGDPNPALGVPPPLAQSQWYGSPPPTLVGGPATFSYVDPVTHLPATTSLRWGWTRPTANPNGLGRWPGWGFRHIYAKHSWTGLDYAETASTLESPLSASPQGDPTKPPRRLVFMGAQYPGTGGATCRRIVIVDTLPRTWANPPAAESNPAGVVTSYADIVP
jgi:hypothetical protein